MINEEILLKNGYRECKDYLYHANRLFQKKIKNEYGIVYFINFYEYTKYDKVDYEIHLQFEKDRYVMDITLFGFNDMELNELEKEVHNIWYRLGCKYYEVNDER